MFELIIVIRFCFVAGILKVVDDGMANITAALHATGRWADTLLWVSSDNGGIGPGVCCDYLYCRLFTQ